MLMLIVCGYNLFGFKRSANSFLSRHLCSRTESLYIYIFDIRDIVKLIYALKMYNIVKISQAQSNVLSSSV